MMWHLSFKTACQIYNSLEMGNDGKMPEQKFAGVEFQIPPTEYHTWGFTVFFLEALFQGGMPGLYKWQPRESNRVYIGHSLLHTVSVDLLLSTRTGHIPPSTMWYLKKYSTLCST